MAISSSYYTPPVNLSSQANNPALKINPIQATLAQQIGKSQGFVGPKMPVPAVAPKVAGPTMPAPLPTTVKKPVAPVMAPLPTVAKPSSSLTSPTAVRINPIANSTQNTSSTNQYSQMQKMIDDFTKAQSKRPSLVDLQAQFSNQLGLPQAQQQYQGLSDNVTNLTNQINTLPDRVAGENRGFDTNANQQASITEQRGIPLQRNLGTATQNLNQAGQYVQNLNNTLGQRLGLAAQDNSDQSSQQLQLLMAKLQSGQHLSDQEIQQANTLTNMEKQNQLDKDKIAFSTNEDLRKSSSDNNAWLKSLQLANSNGAGSIPDLNKYLY